MAYYGDPEAFRQWNRNVKSLDEDFESQVAVFDSVVRLKIESDLSGIFSSIPAPTSKMDSVISVLWLYQMTEELQETKGSVVARPAQYGEKIETKYEKLLREIKSGEKIIPGAVRVGCAPQVRIYTAPRFKPRDFDEPIVVGDVIRQHQLRA